MNLNKISLINVDLMYYKIILIYVYYFILKWSRFKLMFLHVIIK